MARTFEEYSEDEKGKLKRAMERVNPDYYSRVRGNTDALKRIQSVVEQGMKLREQRETSHIEARNERTKLEADAVRREREAFLDSVTPETRIHLMSHDAILSEARKRVRILEQQELDAIDTSVNESAKRIAEQTNPTTIKENDEMSEQTKRSHLKADIHQLCDKADEARFQAAKLLNSQRSALIAAARENGSFDPEGDFRSLQRSQYRDISKQLHSDIHAAFKSYGYEADRQEIEFHARHGSYNSMDAEQQSDTDQLADHPHSERSQRKDQDQ